MSKINEQVQFFLTLGVTQEGIDALIQGFTAAQVHHDLVLLKTKYHHLPDPLEHFIANFSTWLWTILGEIAIPEMLGTYIVSPWPVLVYPFGFKYVVQIQEFIESEYCYVIKQEELLLTPLLHACLYGGQPWYPSLRKVYLDGFGSKPQSIKLLWLDTTEKASCTLAALARKLQLQLRPRLPAWEIKVPGHIYPGIQRAFHTPHLGNVGIHKMILEKEIWR